MKKHGHGTIFFFSKINLFRILMVSKANKASMLSYLRVLQVIITDHELVIWANVRLLNLLFTASLL